MDAGADTDADADEHTDANADAALAVDADDYGKNDDDCQAFSAARCSLCPKL